MTFRYSFVCLSFFLSFFLLFLPNANAYTMFSYNPYFDSNISGLVFNQYQAGGSPPSINGTFYFNSSCFGLNGCLQINDYANGNSNQNLIYLTEGFNPAWQTYFTNKTLNDLYDVNNGFETLFLPKNKEGIIIFNYYPNSSLVNIPRVYINDAFLKTNIISYPMTIIPNVWNNNTIFINASSNDRFINVFAWLYNSNNATFYIDKFKFYTLDELGISDSWINIVEERIKYCGENSTLDENIYGFVNLNGTYSNNGWIFANDSENIKCSVFKLGDATITRRILSEESNFSYPFGVNATTFVKYRDFYVFRGCDSYDGWYYYRPLILINKLTLSTISYKVLEPQYALNSNMTTYLNGNPSTSYRLLDNKESPDNAGLFNNWADNLNFNETSMLNYSNNTNPSGTLWAYENIVYSPSPLTSYLSYWYPFFDSLYIFTNVCTPHYEYNPLTNNQSYVLANCSRVDETYCGDCGGNETTGLCIQGNLNQGTFCDVNDNTSKKFYTYFITGCSNYVVNGTCGQNQQCVFHGTTNSIECFNIATGTHDYCVNANGSLDTSCSGITLPTLCNVNNSWVDCTTEPAQQGVQFIISYLGVVGSFIVSLIVSFALSIFIMSRDKKGHWAMPSFMVSMFISLGGFTFIGMFPTWFFVVVIAILVLGIYWAFRGGKD